MNETIIFLAGVSSGLMVAVAVARDGNFVIWPVLITFLVYLRSGRASE